MQNDKEHLNVDLGFLDEAQPREAETLAKSGYKVNWRNIAIIGGLMVAVFIWANLDDKSSTSRKSSPAPVASAPVYQPPATNTGGTVQNGRFRCSRYDSNQADQLSPGNESELTLQQQEVARRRNALDSLTTQINLSNVNQYSGKAAIDIYNALVEQYNAQLTSFKSDVVAYQARVDRFNAQVVVHNNYLLEHCRSGR